jgi:hypothetical protein
MIRLDAGHRANHHDLIHDLGGVEPEIGNLKAPHGVVDHLRRTHALVSRFRIERLILARPSTQPEEDAGHPAPL